MTIIERKSNQIQWVMNLIKHHKDDLNESTLKKLVWYAEFVKDSCEAHTKKFEEQQKALERNVNVLSGRDKTIYRLYELEGQTAKMVAASIGCHERTVRRAISRTRGLLAQKG